MDELLDRLNEYYGSTYKPEGKLILRKEKLFLYSGPDTKLPYDWIGSHIANTDLSLSIEGAQKLGTTATKNVVTVTKEEAERYYQGVDLLGYPGCGHRILKTTERIIGPGEIQDDTIKNTLPQSRKTS
ncbi:MAG: hypothetical protein V1744_08255 [Candidatus Altiarchaeota archaeon]